MLNDIARGYRLVARYAGGEGYTVTTDPEGSVYTGVTLDDLEVLQRKHLDKFTFYNMPMDWPNGPPSEP